MARIEPEEQPKRRRRVPRVRWQLRSVAAVVILFAPVAYLAPTEWLRAAAVGAVVAASWLVGYSDGRAAHAIDDVRMLYSARGTPDGVRRDVPAA